MIKHFICSLFGETLYDPGKLPFEFQYPTKEALTGIEADKICAKILIKLEL